MLGPGQSGEVREGHEKLHGGDGRVIHFQGRDRVAYLRAKADLPVNVLLELAVHEYRRHGDECAPGQPKIALHKLTPWIDPHYPPSHFARCSKRS